MSCSQESYEDEKGNEIHRDFVPLDYKARAIEAYDKHKGKWKFSTFQQQFPKVKQHNYITRWRQHLEMGGSKYEAYEQIEQYVLERFRECRDLHLPCHDLDLKK